jgi:adenylosuccinate lyase
MAHDCEHPRGAIVDSRFYGHIYATDASRRIFCDVCRFQRWLDVESALAQSQADLGILTRETADAISASARVELLDLDWIRDEIRRTSHSLVGLVRALQRACPDEAGQFVHYGATTQDIQDTGQALEMREVLDEHEAILGEIVELLAELAQRHAGTVMTGRTHAQPALPITFGLKVASWVDELLRTLERMRDVRGRALVVELFGGVGSMASFGSRGGELVERLGTRLGLGVPQAPWHASRDRVAEYVAHLAMATATLARIADEIRTLSRPELGELERHWQHGKVGSSTMPHKRNPEDCQQVVVLARLAAAHVPVAIQAMVVEHERDSRELRTEWASVGDVSHYALAAASITRHVVSGLAVRDDAMLRNAERLSMDLATERLMLAIGERIGKQSAYDLVYDLAQDAKSSGRPLRDALLESDAVLAAIDAEEIDAAFDPSRYVGSSAEIVEGVLARVEEWRRTRGRPLAVAG